MAKKKTETKEVKKVDLRKLKKDERPAPSTGQSGPSISLPAEKINKDERLVLKELGGEDREPLKIVTLADSIRKAKRNEFTPLRTRNALRRLVRGGLVTQKERGTYKITAKGSKVAEVIDEVPLPAKGSKATKAAKGTSKKTKEPKLKAAKVSKAQASADVAPKKAKKAKGKKLGASPKTAEDTDEAPLKVESTIAFNDEVETELAQFGGTYKRTDPHYKGAILVAAIRTAGVSDTKIAKATGLSRGFCMPRVKRLKAAGVISAPGTDDEFKNLVAIAEGHGPDDEPELPEEPEDDLGAEELD
jgi:hypothetical protein